MPLNIKLLRQIQSILREQPEDMPKHDQGEWMDLLGYEETEHLCDTSCCVAGYAVLLTYGKDVYLDPETNYATDGATALGIPFESYAPLAGEPRYGLFTSTAILNTEQMIEFIDWYIDYY
jgi:hypothetical protein